jgi:hypothetical protein
VTEMVMICICGYELHKNGVHKTMYNVVVDGVASARLVITQHARDRPDQSSAQVISPVDCHDAAPLNLHLQAQTRL